MKRYQPPKWAIRFLIWFCRDDLSDAVLGDLQELYERRRKKIGKRRADWLFIWNVLQFLRPFAFKHQTKNSSKLIPIDMFRHNLLLTYRNFKRYKSSFFINLIGLSTGLASVLLIFLWVNDEMSFDKFHEKNHRLYQVMRNIGEENNIRTRESNSDLLATALAEEMPEIEYAVPVSRVISRGILSSSQKNIKADGQFVGKDFFNTFSFTLIQGDRNQVLQDKYSMVVSNDLAVKLFGSPKKAMGQTVSWDHKIFGGSHVITGIFQKPAGNSTEVFDFLATHALFMEKSPMDVSWHSNPVYIYLTLKQGIPVDPFNDKIADFIKTKNKRSKEKLFLRRYSDKYLFDHYENGRQAGGRIDYVILFSAIALFILVIACINFMNLSTARASRRLKEVGIKKVVGARQQSFIFQYGGEAMLLSFISLTSAILLVFLFLPQFNFITGKALSIELDWNLIFGALIITVFTGFVSGSYPALYLSRFKPSEVLKGKLKTSAGQLWTRRGLVIFQFSISILLIVSVVIVYKQIDFAQSKHLGYEKDNVITFEKQGRLNESLASFLAEAKNISGVVNATALNGSITNNNSGSGGHSWEGQSAHLPSITFTSTTVGYDYIETLGMEMKEGRSFSRKFANEEEAKIILNEKAVKMMELSEPVGKWVKLWGTKREVIGVVKDFHFQSLYKEIRPMFLLCDPGHTTTIVVKINAGFETTTVKKLEELYHLYNPDIPFDFKFLDDDYEALYRSEQKVADLSRSFAGIAILISCLGLFGLAAFTAERRVKEIGIRKILGSTSLGIVRLLLADFTNMVLIAIVVALPVSYLIAKSWLNGFAYKISLEWWFFIGAGLMVLVIAWSTVGIQAIKAARVNPVKCLKDE
ncbi:ABC transporter permease [Fulvivirgaceae bacterium BMA12]|uniref:ABC transporter permease n=1 Tax=Agaribacillus aureus TaxID=3051825 RepID=A0ABT8L6T5_9BACT|nr:ABC transporter permease [Fulvivirgaceae bacterium BMA12]